MEKAFKVLLKLRVHISSCCDLDVIPSTIGLAAPLKSKSMLSTEWKFGEQQSEREQIRGFPNVYSVKNIDRDPSEGCQIDS